MTDEPQNGETTESFNMPKRINKKVAKMQNEDSLSKFKDEQAKNEHFERYNKETDKDKKKKMLSEAVKEGWL